MSDDPRAEAAIISGHLDQLTRRMHGAGYGSRLFPAQWAALRYLKSAPAELRTASDLARFQGLASGPVARTVRTLIEKGFVEKKGTIGRGRAEGLDLTKQGRALLRKDPLMAITKGIERLPSDERAALNASLPKLLQAIGVQIADEPDGAASEAED